MDLLALTSGMETVCATLAQKADSVIKLWANAKDLQDERELGGVTKKALLNGLWEIRHNMQVNLGQLSFEVSMLHVTVNGALEKLDYTDAKMALLERTLKHMIQAQEAINRAQGAADMVSIMLQDAVSG